MCLYKKSNKKKESYNCTDNINIEVIKKNKHITFGYKTKCKANTNMLRTHGNE